MGKVVYSMGVSLDGFIGDPAGRSAWETYAEEKPSAPEHEHRHRRRRRLTSAST